MYFKSDNTSPAHEKIMQAILNVNQGHAASYGQDDYCLQAKEVFKEIFDYDVHVFFVTTGSIANSLALATSTPPYGSILTSEDAHVQMDEANCVEQITGGAKLKALPSIHGKIQVASIADTITSALLLRPHMAKPSALTITQATEWGTVYSVDEITQICQEAHAYGLKTHMDGARFANALVHLEAQPSDITWRAGLDILSFGATKNGALQAEAIVVFNPNLAHELDYRIKQAGQLPAKQRFWAAQFLSYFQEDLWLDLALHANEMAQRVAYVFQTHGYELMAPVQANEVFVNLPTEIADHLLKQGALFYPWGSGTHSCYRFVTSWCTQHEEINALQQEISLLNGTI